MAPPRARRLPCVWKLSYFEAEWDSQRKTLSIEELCGHLWSFHFLHQWHHPSPKFIVRYNADFTYDSCMFMGPLPWRLVGASSLQVRSIVKLSVKGRENRYQFRSTTLQVDAYPALQASRHPVNWGWSLENMYVRMDQLDVPCSQYEVWQAYALQVCMHARRPL